MSVTVNTSGLLYDFLCLRFVYAHRETSDVSSTLTGEFPEESDQCCFPSTVCLDNLKGSLDLILSKASTMRVTSLVEFPQHSAEAAHDVRSFCKLHRLQCASQCSVTFFFPDSRLFFSINGFPRLVEERSD